MKIALPLISESELASDFSKSSYVGIYDVVEGNLNVISLASQSMTTIQSFIFETMKSLDTQWVISPNFSFMALRVFKENKINVLKASGTNLNENIDFFKTGILVPFSAFDVFMSSQNCTDVCSTCGSQCLK